MNKILHILLVEDDEYACLNLRIALEKYGDMTLVATTNNAMDALQLTKYHLPDIVILDLELHGGGSNGFLYLQALRNMELRPMPYILVTTNNPSTVTKQIAKDLGADFTLLKSEDGYSAEYVADMIHVMKESILKTRKISISSSTEPASPEVLNRRLQKRICRELELVGIKPKHSGYKYLVDAITIAYDNPIPNISTTLAKQYQHTAFSIDRAMQNAINYAWSHTDIEDLLLYYTAKISSEKGVPTVTEFVYYYANKIRHDL